MIFNWFSSKKELKRLKYDFNALESNVESAFKNIRIDMINVNKWVTGLDQNDKILLRHTKEQQERIEQLEVNVNWLATALEQIRKEKQVMVEYHEQPHEKHQEETSVIKVRERGSGLTNIEEDSLKSLTSTQLELFQTITLLNEGNQKNVCTPQQAAKIMYPKRPYEVVRTTLSEYLTMLEDFGLITKDRKGRYIYIRLTKKATELIKKLKKKKKLKAKAK